MSEKDEGAGSAQVVDFDALNAALGAAPPPSQPALPDSEGRSSATYSSARPHVIPVTRGPQEVPNEPAVIIQPDDTVQTGPPVHMTAPIAPHGRISSGPHVAAPPTEQHHSYPPAPPYVAPAVAVPAPPIPPGGQAVPRPRGPRPGMETIVLAPTQGPTRQQKFLVFFAMLVIVVSGGLAVLVYLKPETLSAVRNSGLFGAPTSGAPRRAH